ncbi:hypothetical protein GCM10010259_09740 [Streptomyces daghestanicus]|nr:hypothetical protein GCM10010259_09740 [Streptomyces daghestanicus]
MGAAQPGGDGQLLGGIGVAHLVEEGAAGGGEEGVEVVHRAIVGQSVDRPPPGACRGGSRTGGCEDPAPCEQ